ncbi:MAG: hypothetical protein HRT61_20675, partial [Ekhidna sp.]|nr:hypothetical protein [Ekhidna sp.]
LPLDISDKLSDLDVEKTNLPGSKTTSRLLITQYTGSKIELTLLYRIDVGNNKYSYHRFTSDLFEFNDKFHKLGEQNLFLQSDIRQKTSQDDIIELQAANNLNDFQSYGVFNCRDGFKYFYITGAYRAYYNNGDQDDSKSKLITVEEQSKRNTTIGFVLNTSLSGNAEHSLTNFIARLTRWDGTTELNRTWDFSTNVDRQLVFMPGEKVGNEANLIDAYIDFSNDRNLEDFSGENGYESVHAATANMLSKSFKGLVFKKINFKVTKLKKNGSDDLVVEMEDAVYSFEKGLFAKYYGENLVLESANAELSSWRYTLDKLSFDVRNNDMVVPADVEADDVRVGRPGVNIQGKIHVPIFDKNPPKNLSSVEYASGFLPYAGFIVYDRNVLLDMRVAAKEIHRKIFHSAFVPGLGFRVNTTSKLTFYYEIDAGDFNAQAKFDGIAMITLSKELLDNVKDFNKDDIPDGIDFTFPYFTFQDIKINEGNGFCGTAFQGIKTLEFGTWGILPELKIPKEKAKQLDGADDLKPNFQSVELKVESPSFICDESDKYKFILAATLSFKKDEEVDDNSGPDKARYPPPPGQPAPKKSFDWLADQYPADKPPYSYEAVGTKKKKKQTSNFTAAGQLNFVFSSKDDKLQFERLDLGCFYIDAEFGPVKLSGGINILQGGTTAGSLYGDGFKAYVGATIGPVTGRMVGQLGKVKQTVKNSKANVASEFEENADFDYFFFDLEVLYDKGFNIIPSKPIAAIYGGYGGLRYNMEEVPFTFKTKYAAKANNNDLCAVPGDYLEAGKGITGESYTPYKGKHGINFNLIAGTPYPSKAFVADIGIDIQVKEDKESVVGLSFDAITVRGFGSFLYEDLDGRRTKNAMAVKVDGSYNFSDEFLSISAGYQAKLPRQKPFFFAPADIVNDKGIKEFLKKQEEAKKKAIKEENPEKKKEILESVFLESKGSDWNEGRLNFDFANDSWELKFGSWSEGSLSSPSGLKFLTHRLKIDPLDVTLSAYFQMGNDVDPLPPIDALIPNYQGGTNAKANRAPFLYKS